MLSHDSLHPYQTVMAIAGRQDAGQWLSNLFITLRLADYQVRREEVRLLEDRQQGAPFLHEGIK